MGLNLSDLFQKEQYHSSLKATMPSQVEVVNGKYAGGQGGQLYLQPGQQFKGTVVGTEGDRVLIKTEDNIMFSARLDKGMNIQNGMTLSFEVKGIQGNQIALTPLYSNLTQDSSIIKALQAAELPITENSIQMVNEMMSQGMGIDKLSLQSMFHLLGQYEETDPATLVQMKQMQLPITSENIISFENFRSNTAQIVDSYTEIGKQITDILQDMAGKQDYEGIGKLFAEIMKSISSESENTVNRNTEEFGQEQVPSGETQETGGKQEQSQTAESIQPDVKSPVHGSVQADMTATARETVQTDSELMNRRTVQERVEPETEQMNRGSVQEGAQVRTEQMIPEGMPSGSAQALGMQEGNRPVVMSGFVNPSGEIQLQEFVGFLMSELSGKSQTGSGHIYSEAGQILSELMQNPEFEHMFCNILTKDWLIKPQDVSEKDGIKALYERVLKQTDSLERILSEAGRGESTAAKSLQNMTKNVEFLNELNQNFAYVQLPLKMSEQNAHGDLYVYTKKRNLTEGDGTVTALLHLSMEHLGNLDVYVAMQDRKVSTKFYLENEEIIDFLAQHIEELNKRINAKGYSMSAQLLPQDHKDTGNVFDEMLADSHGVGKAPVVMLNRQSFDARA